MPKKPSAKAKKKVTRPAKAASKRPRAAKAASKTARRVSGNRRARQLAEKYGQAGAPWWKQFLPG